MDLDRLAKLMGLTTSDQDGEALNAIRMANKLLAAEKTTWSEILGTERQNIRISITRSPMQETYQSEENWCPPHLKDQVVLNQMFGVIYKGLGPADTGFKEFIDSVHKYYRTHGAVTNGQYQALRRAYNRASRATA